MEEKTILEKIMKNVVLRMVRIDNGTRSHIKKYWMGVKEKT